MSAFISGCERYRYVLQRSLVRFDPNAESVTLKRMVFVMLNPSTADAMRDDPTIRRCIFFAEREECNVLTVVNLYALRATNPAALAKASDPIGPENDKFLFAEIAQATMVVAAWGAHPSAKPRAEFLIKRRGRALMCLGKTKDGSPRHPLYVRGDQPLEVLA